MCNVQYIYKFKNKEQIMRLVITVVGKDRVGIVSDIASICKELHVNIMDITQKVFDDMFAMVMLAQMTDSSAPFETVADRLEKCGDDAGLKIHTMHEDIFNSMHRI